MLTIKDLAVSKSLDRKEMAAVHGGYSGAVTQDNTTNQQNVQNLDASLSIGNGSAFMGKGVNFNIDSSPSLTASNKSHSSNSSYRSQGWGFPVLF